MDPVKEVADSQNIVDLHPSLEEVVKSHSLDSKKLSVAWRVENDQVQFGPREEILVHDGTNGAVWKAPPIRTLFRGDKIPPAFGAEPSPYYVPLFYFIEAQVVTICNGIGDKTDGEFEESFSNLRRRPDGKSLTELHHCLWHVAACLVARRPISAAEFDAIFGRLTRSARTFQIGLVSRNYITVLREMGRRLHQSDEE